MAIIMKNNGRLLECAALAAMAVTVLFSLLGFGETCEEVRGAVLRLHVVANSDSAADQALKLTVRDALLDARGDLFAAAETKEQAKQAARDALPTLRSVAEKVVAQHGAPYCVQVELARSPFPTRTYGDVTLPAGTYDAVKVTLGSGGGHNWWCVMFPPLCLPAVSDGPTPEELLSRDALTLVGEQPKLEVRFWLVEKFEALRSRLRSDEGPDAD